LFLLTGASGYVGRAVQQIMVQRGHALRVAGRSRQMGQRAGTVFYDIDQNGLPGLESLAGVSCVIHCAGLAHRLVTPDRYQIINVEAPAQLAALAAASGVRHFIFVSSLNVVPVDASQPDLDAAGYDEPDEHYAASKWLAEQRLQQTLAGTGCALTIVRPGLVYDMELVANLAYLARLVRWFPVSLPDVGCRKMVNRQDLAALIASCAEGGSGSPAGQPVVVGTDGQCYSAARVTKGISGRVLAIALPAWLCRMTGRVIDFSRGFEAGVTWRAISHHYWCGSAPIVKGWQAELTLESRRAGAARR
jgi:nucleoside-diphosphate-sugar epimerase